MVWYVVCHVGDHVVFGHVVLRQVVLGPVVLGPVVLGPVVLGPVVLGPVVFGRQCALLCSICNAAFLNFVSPRLHYRLLTLCPAAY